MVALVARGEREGPGTVPVVVDEGPDTRRVSSQVPSLSSHAFDERSLAARRSSGKHRPTHLRSSSSSKSQEFHRVHQPRQSLEYAWWYPWES